MIRCTGRAKPEPCVTAQGGFNLEPAARAINQGLAKFFPPASGVAVIAEPGRCGPLVHVCPFADHVKRSGAPYDAWTTDDAPPGQHCNAAHSDLGGTCHEHAPPRALLTWHMCVKVFRGDYGCHGDYDQWRENARQPRHRDAAGDCPPQV